MTSWYNKLVKAELLDILACPVCKGNLELRVEKEDGRDVVAGMLYCLKCEQRYTIEDSIPRLLPPEPRS